MSSSQWHRIEQAYGHSLDSRGRKEIGDATNDFLYWIQGETDQGLMSDAVKQVERIGKNARSLLSAINDDSIPLGTRDYVDHQISIFSAITPAGTVCGRRDYLRSFSAAVSSFESACNRALEDIMRASRYEWWREGAGWDSWINKLIKIAKGHHLPAEVRKDTDKNKAGKSSPFVAFVRELQGCIPAEFRRAVQSNGALAVAISNARRKPKSPHRSRRP